MNYKLINHTRDLPFNISIIPLKNEEYHYHKEVELIFVLEGNLSYFVNLHINKLD